MRQPLRHATVFAAAFLSLTACQKKTTDDVQPVTVRGEWQLAVSGGGITGVMSPVPAGYDHRMVLGPDSAYAEYENGRLTQTSTYQFRRQPSRFGGPDGQLLVIKTYNTPDGQPLYYPYYVTGLTADRLHFTTGTGCALNVEYVRVKPGSAPVATR